MLWTDLLTYTYLPRMVLQIIDELLRHIQARYDQLLQINSALPITRSYVNILDVFSALLYLGCHNAEVPNAIHPHLSEALPFVRVLDFHVP